jgi:hypothetical protein
MRIDSISCALEADISDSSLKSKNIMLYAMGFAHPAHFFKGYIWQLLDSSFDTIQNVFAFDPRGSSQKQPNASTAPLTSVVVAPVAPLEVHDPATVQQART